MRVWAWIPSGSKKQAMTLFSLKRSEYNVKNHKGFSDSVASWVCIYSKTPFQKGRKVVVKIYLPLSGSPFQNHFYLKSSQLKSSNILRKIIFTYILKLSWGDVSITCTVSHLKVHLVPLPELLLLEFSGLASHYTIPYLATFYFLLCLCYTLFQKIF